jgi:hypothetical protein
MKASFRSAGECSVQLTWNHGMGNGMSGAAHAAPFSVIGLCICLVWNSDGFEYLTYRELNFFLVRFLRNRQFFNEKIAGLIKQSAFPVGKIFVFFQEAQVAKYFSRLKDTAASHLVLIFPLATIPRYGIRLSATGLQDLNYLGNRGLVHNLSYAVNFHFLDRQFDYGALVSGFYLGFQDITQLEGVTYSLLLNIRDPRHTVNRVNDNVSDLEHFPGSLPASQLK